MTDKTPGDVHNITDLPKRKLRDRLPTVPPKVKTALAVVGGVTVVAAAASVVSKRKSLNANIDVTLPNVDVTSDAT